jgi:hypothetical protein
MQDDLNDMPLLLRRKVAELLALKQQERGGMQAASQLAGTEYTPQGIAVKRSPLEYLARAGQMGVHGYNAQEYGKQADAELAGADTARTTEMQSVLDALYGRKARELQGPQPEGTEGPLMDPGQKPSVSDAILKARTGQFPSTRAVGADLQKRMLDLRAEATKGLMKDATPSSMQQYMTSGDPSNLQPKPNYMQSGEAILLADQNSPGLKALTPDRYSPASQNVAGVTVPAQTDTFTGKTTPVASTAINANPVEKSRARWSENDAKLISEGRIPAQKVAQSLEIIGTLSKELQNAYTAGSLADQRMAVSKFTTLIGGVPDPKAINAEYIQGLLNKLGISDAKSLGVNPTDRDLQIIQQSIGTINTDPAALPRLLSTIYRLNSTALGQYNNYIQQTQGAEQKMDPSADLSRYMIQAPTIDTSVLDRLGATAETPANRAPQPPTPPSGRRRISVIGNVFELEK